ncbi:MAG: inosine-5-monophosphate dehydrogenase [Verrucomicrobiaceae bacterium]|nr:inosine-5-monophosphate dehydrogenase [Verrucomicrobiaceae bacterium]
MTEEEKSKILQADRLLSDVLQHQTGVLKTGDNALNTDDSVQTAGETMRSAGQESMPVSEDGRFIGMVENSGAEEEASRYGHDPAHTTVAESMSREIICCFEDEDCRAALVLMNKHGLAILPVVTRDMRIVGIVNRKDLAGKVSVPEIAGL